MSDLFGSITSNLAYEFLGVFLPGMIASIFLLLFWIALGPATPYWTFGVLPQFSMTTLDRGLNSLSPISGASIVIPLLAIWYFAGHLLLWLGRMAPILPGRQELFVSTFTALTRLCLPK